MRFQRLHFLSASRVDDPPPEARVIDVSSYAEDPWRQFSPFFPHGDIPVPGMPGVVSDSVEGIWQGLKVIRGSISTRHFRGAGRKRGGKPAGHQFGKRLLKLIDARYRIYRVAYEWMLEHCAPADAVADLLDRARAGESQVCTTWKRTATSTVMRRRWRMPRCWCSG